MQLKQRIRAQFNNLQSNRGFTLIETFVAVAVLMIAIVGPLSLAQQSLSTATATADEITAYYLAQDAMEFMRNIRDSNIQSGNDWLNGLTSSNCLDGVHPCTIDTSQSLNISTALTKCSSGTCPVLKYDSATNRYGYSTGSNSTFRRSVNIEVVDPEQEIKITVTVNWTTGDFNGVFKAQQSMFNFGL